MKSIATAFAVASMMLGTPALAELALAEKYNCMACHTVATPLVGPSYADIAAKYAGDPDAASSLAGTIKAGSPGGVWGAIPMAPNPAIPDADVAILVGWILDGAK